MSPERPAALEERAVELPGPPRVRPRHLLSVADLGRDGIEEVLRLADSFEIGRAHV